MHDKFGLADTFASGLEQALWSERRLQYENGFAAAGFRLDDFSGSVAADLFVRGPEKNQSMCERSFAVLQSFESEERLRETGFHIEDAGAIRFSAGTRNGISAREPVA